MRIPIRPIRGRWPSIVQKHAERFMRDDPRVLLAGVADPESFRSAMSNIHVGDTIKITGTTRHPLSDSLLTDNLDLTGSTILDIGASDGSTSVDLIGHIGTFRAYVIADLYLQVTAARVGRTIVFRDPAANDILVAGTRARLARALPHRQSAVLPVDQGGAVEGERGRAVAQPRGARLIATDDRVRAQVHDIFDPWPGPQPDVIKVANVLRRLYFTDEQISRALGVLYANLADGGHLLIVDNPRIADIAERGALYRREGGGLVQVAVTANPPEICDLVDEVGREPLRESHAG